MERDITHIRGDVATAMSQVLQKAQSQPVEVALARGSEYEMKLRQAESIFKEGQKHQERHLIVSDFQIPDHDKKAIGLVHQFIDDFHPSHVHINGDFLNFTPFSRYDVLAGKQAPPIQEEIKQGRQVLTELTNRARKANPNAEVIWYEGNHECHDYRTELLTIHGWMKYNEITLDTDILTVDKNTHKLKIEKPIDIQVYPYEGKMYSIKNKQTDLLVSPNHRIYYRQRGKWKIDEISKIAKNGSHAYLQVSSTLDLPEYPISDDEIRISAWLLTDGSIKAPSKRGKQEYVHFYQRESKHHMITEILDNLGWKYSLKKRYRNITHIMGKLLKSHEAEMKINLLSPFHKKMLLLVPSKKTLPDWVNKLSDRQFEVFLSSFIDGDGSRHISAPETSLMVYGVKDIIEQLQTACFRHGYRTSITEYRIGNFRLNITKNATTCLESFKKKVKVVNYSGIIWDVTTPSDTMIVRRNGKISITGNSRLFKFIVRQALGSKSPLLDLELDGEEVLSIPHLFKLKELGVEWVPERKSKKIHDFFIEHGDMVRKYAGYTGQGMMERKGSSGTTGHTHRLALVSRTNATKTMFWIESGSLCHSRPSPQYAKDADWQKGFGVMIYDKRKKQVYPAVVPIIKNSFMFGGKLYR